MKKNIKSKAAVAPQVDPYLEGLMAKLLEHLVGLEKKMDAVIAQTAPRSAAVGSPTHTAQSPEIKPPARRDRVLYEAICADCNKVCEVPFKPSVDRPVYCKDCFAVRKGRGPAKPGPVLTPVAMPAPVAAKPPVLQQASVPVSETSKKTKKNQPAKKAKKKK
ncbi:MAG: CxxC-x17-CxxC domain-containing protein [Candidatus Omnitrophota bacterium]